MEFMLRSGHFTATRAPGDNLSAILGSVRSTDFSSKRNLLVTSLSDWVQGSWRKSSIVQPSRSIGPRMAPPFLYHTQKPSEQWASSRVLTTRPPRI